MHHSAVGHRTVVPAVAAAGSVPKSSKSRSDLTARTSAVVRMATRMTMTMMMMMMMMPVSMPRAVARVTLG